VVQGRTPQDGSPPGRLLLPSGPFVSTVRQITQSQISLSQQEVGGLGDERELRYRVC
jgi:hypothetical protein